MAAIDLSQLPPLQIVNVPDFETLLAERKEGFVALYPADQQEAVRRTLVLESEPITKQLQESTYREVLLRQRINEAALAIMVAYSNSNDLDQLAANCNVKRLIVTPADNDAVPADPRGNRFRTYHYLACRAILVEDNLLQKYLIGRHESSVLSR